MDVAVDSRSALIWLKMKAGALFVGTLMVRKGTWAGLLTEWRPRHVVVTYRLPRPAAPAADRVTRKVRVCAWAYTTHDSDPALDVGGCLMICCAPTDAVLLQDDRGSTALYEGLFHAVLPCEGRSEPVHILLTRPATHAIPK